MRFPYWIETDVSQDPITYGETLLKEFFPCPGRGFYETFENYGAALVKPTSSEGLKLIQAVGLRVHQVALTQYHVCEDIHCCEEDDVPGNCWPVKPTILSLPGKWFVGYWDGDGMAIIGRTVDETWVYNGDIKDPHDWEDIPSPLMAV